MNIMKVKRQKGTFLWLPGSIPCLRRASLPGRPGPLSTSPRFVGKGLDLYQGFGPHYSASKKNAVIGFTNQFGEKVSLAREGGLTSSKNGGRSVPGVVHTAIGDLLAGEEVGAKKIDNETPRAFLATNRLRPSFRRVVPSIGSKNIGLSYCTRVGAQFDGQKRSTSTAAFFFWTSPLRRRRNPWENRKPDRIDYIPWESARKGPAKCGPVLV